MITIHAPAPHRAELIRVLWDLADGDRSQVQATGTGVRVSAELARTYLNAVYGDADKDPGSGKSNPDTTPGEGDSNTGEGDSNTGEGDTAPAETGSAPDDSTPQDTEPQRPPRRPRKTTTRSTTGKREGASDVV